MYTIGFAIGDNGFPFITATKLDMVTPSVVNVTVTVFGGAICVFKNAITSLKLIDEGEQENVQHCLTIAPFTFSLRYSIWPNRLLSQVD
jgi:hypothetical protein